MNVEPFDGYDLFVGAEKRARMAEYAAGINELKYREHIAASLRMIAEATGHLSNAVFGIHYRLEKVSRRLDALERDRRKL